MTYKEQIKELIEKKGYTPQTITSIASVLGIGDKDIVTLKEDLDELYREGFVFQTAKRKYARPNSLGLVFGQFEMSKSSYGFIRQSETEDVFVPRGHMLDAINGDMVYAKLVSRSGNRLGGDIVAVAMRGEKPIIGVFRRLPRGDGLVIPDDEKFGFDVFIDKSMLGNAKNGDKVSVDIIKIRKNRSTADGKIIKVLGNKNDADMQITEILYRHNIETDFPLDVLAEAKSFQDIVPKSEIDKRLDLRDKTIITIDGEDAKDLDDAVSVELLPNKNYRLGVHIADVSHYVREGKPLDNEAFSRGTSTYLPGTVIPMLPQELSNGICSLNPQVNRLCLSALMEIDCNGAVVDYSIHKTVIKTKFRMTYTNVTKLLEAPTSELLSKYESILADLNLMKDLALILTKKRHTRGSINFNFPESYIKLDESGKVTDIVKREISLANNIIEEFMLVCNETVAEHIFRQDLPFVYRIHEAPSNDKFADFSKFLSGFGYTIKGTAEGLHPKSFQQIADLINGKKEEKMISTMMLRSMMKAKYLETNQGHFGLAAKYYCHFTSPIRRYPDLVIHRILSETLLSKLTPKRISSLERFVKAAALRASEREVAAAEAERDVEDIKKAEYMASHLGEEFVGVISSITGFGMFVELENTVEGLIRLNDLRSDTYIFEEQSLTLSGMYSGKQYHIGDSVTVVVAKADPLSGQIDFVIEEELGSSKGGKR